MKTIKIKFLVTTILLALFSLSAISQEIVRFDVNGIDVAMDKYTKAQVIAKWGTPLKYIYDDDCESYHYANSWFNFINKGELVDFAVKDPQFKFFGGKVKVGDPLSVLQSLPKYRFVQGNTIDYEHIYSELWVGYAEFPFYIRHKDGIITSISYTEPL